MKSEAEIRQHLRDLVVLVETPCRCVGTEHAVDCVLGGHMMRAAASVLAWALGEDQSYQATVDRMRAGADDYIASG